MPEQLNSADSTRSPPLRVGLFVTCLADLFRPSVGFSSLTLLQRAGCEVFVPHHQTCCGQPAYSTGDYASTEPLAKQLIERFETYDYLVVPSGSCAGMISHHYPKLLHGEWRTRAEQLALKTFELTAFLNDIVKLQRGSDAPVQLPPVTYHDGCAGMREMGVKQQPRELLQGLCSVELRELQQPEVCCGFGGTFCTKMPAISGKMVNDKLTSALNTKATILTGGDLGCLMNIAGRAHRLGEDIEVRHIAELLAGDLDGPGIGDAK